MAPLPPAILLGENSGSDGVTGQIVLPATMCLHLAVRSGVVVVVVVVVMVVVVVFKKDTILFYDLPRRNKSKIFQGEIHVKKLSKS